MNVEFPDAISPRGGAASSLREIEGSSVSGVQRIGTFGGAQEGRVLYVSFPFASINGADNREIFMMDACNFFELGPSRQNTWYFY